MARDSEIEELISRAIDLLDQNPTMKVSKAAIQVGAPYRRLLNRRKGIPKSSSRGGQNKKLSEPADESLKEYLSMLFYMGRPANKKILVRAANSILRAQGVNSTCSRRWATNWIKRNHTYFRTLRA